MVIQAAEKKKVNPVWFWILVICLPLGIIFRWLIWWFFSPSYQRTAAVEIETPPVGPIPKPIHQDDFTVIKGIGPITAAALAGAGILNFQQLGLIQLDRLERILQQHSLPSSAASFWQQQAALAAAGDWDGFKRLQDR